MKKLRITLTALLLAAAVGIPCMADDAPYYFENQTGTTLMTAGVRLGDLEHAKDVTVTVYDADGALVFVQVLKADKNGKAEVSFYNDGKSGDYTCNFAVRGELLKSVSLKNFKGNDFFAGLVAEANQALTNRDTGALRTLFEANQAELGADTSLYANLQNPDTVFSVMIEDTKTALATQTDFVRAVQRATMTCYLRENPTAKGAEAVYAMEEKYAVLGCDVPNVPEGGTIWNALSDTARTDVMLRIAKRNAKTPEEVREAFYQGFLLDTVAEAQNYNEVSAAISAYQKAGAISVDTNGKTNAVLASVYKAMRGKSYAGFSALENGFSEEMKKATETKKPSGTQGGNGGGGGGGYSISAPIVKQENNGEVGNTQSGTEANTVHSGKMYFRDIEDSKWALDAINYLYETGILSGDGDGKFYPSREVSRPEMAKMLVCLAGYELSDSEVPFYDVASDAWYRPYVAAAYQNGVISGYEDGRFGVSDGITRQEAAALLYRMAQRAKGLEAAENPTRFSDDERIAAWAKDAVYTLHQLGVISGRTKEIFSPSEKLTRAEAAMLLYLAKDYVK